MNTYAEIRKSYLDRGYSSLGVSTNTGAEILRNAELGRVVKITVAGKDPSAYFSEWVKDNPEKHLPGVHSIVEGESRGEQRALNWRPCAIEMEELVPLNGEERAQYRHWIETYLRWRTEGGRVPDDPLGLFDTLEAIHAQAQEMEGAIGVEVRKSRNVMARDLDGERTLVILDPWY